MDSAPHGLHRGQNKPSDDTLHSACSAPGRNAVTRIHRLTGARPATSQNLYPYNTGHLLRAPTGTISITEATPAERQEIGELTATAMSVVRSVSRPTGFNLG